MKSKLIILSIAVALAAFVGSSVTVQAQPITGSIAFDGGYTPNTTPLSAATSVTFPANGQEVTLNQHFGSYLSVPNGTLVTFNGFTFIPASPPVNPLWTFTIGPTTYSFNATTMTSNYNGIQNNWNIAGTGTAKITGFDDTPGTWNLTLSNVGESFSFAATTGVNGVPDGGTTVLLLGAALSALGLIKRRLF